LHITLKIESAIANEPRFCRNKQMRFILLPKDFEEKDMLILMSLSFGSRAR
jgi:hypothetical protein